MKKINCFTGEGISVNSGFLNGLKTEEAKEKIIQYLEEKGIGKKKINYKLRDWIFSRQHYWGEPIPIIHCQKCGMVPDENLPITLPDIKNYEPTDSGESPLAKIKDWVNCKCPKCGAAAKRETDTMPNWAGSSWYFLRYIDPKNEKKFADPEKLKKWLPVDFYNGGMEHTTLHLLYSRFWHKFLYDCGLVSTSEPYKKRRSHGMILASDGQKMSKSRGNVINPDEIIQKYGADTLRVYEMFMGPFDQKISWDSSAVAGVYKFLQKIWRIFQDKFFDDIREDGTCETGMKKEIRILINQTIKKVGEDIDNMKFNTAISQLMIFVNEISKQKKLPKKTLGKFLKLLYPFAPHLAEELWDQKYILKNLKFSVPTEKEFFEIEKIHKQEEISCFQMDKNQFLVAKKENKILGFGRIHKIEDVFSVSSLFVKKEFRGQKVSLKIFLKLIEKSKEQIFYFNCKKELTSFYKKIGAVIIEDQPEGLWQKTKFHREKELGQKFSKEKICKYLNFLKFEKKEKIFELQENLAFEPWPNFNENFLVDDHVTYAIQINGKVRGSFEISGETDKNEVLKQAKKIPNVEKYLTQGKIIKEIFVPKKIIGFVVK